jgi:hypothetical protein
LHKAKDSINFNKDKSILTGKKIKKLLEVNPLKALYLLVGPPGLEPGTKGL